MRVLVCGGRDYKDYLRVKEVLDNLHDEGGHPYKKEITEIIHGDATGADTLAALWASHTWKHNGDSIEVKAFPADWNKHGKSAGYIRNKQMLDEGKPDLVVAFPGGKGTTNMVQLAAKAGIPCISVDDAPTALGMAVEATEKAAGAFKQVALYHPSQKE